VIKQTRKNKQLTKTHFEAPFFFHPLGSGKEKKHQTKKAIKKIAFNVMEFQGC
jgi:hypothetical protein